jgi:hypothetical protein
MVWGSEGRAVLWFWRGERRPGGDRPRAVIAAENALWIHRSFVVLTDGRVAVIVRTPKRTASPGCLLSAPPIRGRPGRGLGI